MHREKQKDELADYVSNDGTYLIPVTWSVYSTVRVKGANLRDALNRFKQKMDECPLPTEAEYVDGSFEMSVDNEEELLDTQKYQDISDLIL